MWDKEWYINDNLHREDGPAMEYANGDKFWFLNGKQLKPKCEIDENGNKFWKLNDKLHREDGPAIECATGYKAWYLNGLLHREDGHAIELANGEKFWYINDQMLTEEEFNKISKKHTKSLKYQDFEILMEF